MKHLAAYLLLQLTIPNPTKEEITALLKTVGITSDQDRLDALFSALKDKNVNEVISPEYSH
jgi:ribosomal protein L12E/L44/L45/RPP1/RPP2